MRRFRNVPGVRGRAGLALLALVAAVLLAVPAGGGAQTLAPAANGVIRVTVAFGGQPLANMAVLVNNSASNPNLFNNFNGANVTDGGGAYEVAVPPGNYDVHVAELAPHNNETYGSQVLYEVGVGDGAFVPLGFDLNRPGGSITGTVRDGAGNPVPGVKVEAFGSFALGDPPPYGWGDTFTDGAGNFRINRLLPNKWYVVFVSALGYRMDQVPVGAGVTTTGVNFPNAVYPGGGGALGAGAPRGSLPTLRGDVPVVGDWDGNGAASIGIKRGNAFFLRNANTSGVSDIALTYGDPGDLGLGGDWDGNGTATVGVWRQGAFYLRNSNTSGVADAAASFGDPTDVPIVGDWDGNGTVTIGVWRAGRFYLRNTNGDGNPDAVLDYGDPGDVPVVGDWDGNGTVTVGVWRAGRFYLRNTNTSGAADVVVAFGDPSDVPVVGDWDGNRTDTPGVRRGPVFYLTNDGGGTALASAVAEYGEPTTVG